jgi:hypothetical protein
VTSALEKGAHIIITANIDEQDCDKHFQLLCELELRRTPCAVMVDQSNRNGPHTELERGISKFYLPVSCVHKNEFDVEVDFDESPKKA